MSEFKVGDYVARKSYGGDIHFKVKDIASRSDGQRVYVLKGLLYRIEADCNEEDLIKPNRKRVYQDLQRSFALESMSRYSRSESGPIQFLSRLRGSPGKILHIDSSEEFLNMCTKFYRQSNIRAASKVISESEQPGYIRSLLASSKADILVVTGHDGIKKDSKNLNSLDSYRNSKYYIQSVKEARKYEPSYDRLCIFAGACQSYFEGIMNAGANFASSPGRILIHALDPAKVADRVALTDSRKMVFPAEVAEITQSGSKGIGGIKTRGHYIES